MTTFQEYRARLLEAILSLAPEPVPADVAAQLAFTSPPNPEMGDLALAAFPLAKSMRKPPAEVARLWAEAISAALAKQPSGLRSEPEAADSGPGRAELEVPVVRVEPAGPYVNLTLDAPALARLVTGAIAEAGPRYGSVARASGQTVMVEYSSPNTNKPLHLGHIRNNLLGMAISNLLEATGDRVIRVNLVNDRGIHICKSMLTYSRCAAGSTPQQIGEKGDHFVGRFYVLFNTHLSRERARWAESRGVDLSRYSRESLRAIEDKNERRAREEEGERLEQEFLAASEWMAAAQDLLRKWEAGDPEVLKLWQTLNNWVYEGFRKSYERLGCRFDRWYYESDVWKLGVKEVERGLRMNIFYRKPDDSVWALLEPLGLKDKLLLRADGTAVYMTQDIGTAVRKFEDYRMDRSLYVVASEQDQHFQNLFAILKLLGHEWADRCHHASYGMVTLPAGRGKLKSREGTSVDADDLLDELHRLALEKIQAGGHAENEAAADATAEQIGQGALKLYILQVGAEKNITFDPEETIAFTGDTGPAVQYSHARIRGILRKGIAEGALQAEELEAGVAASGEQSGSPFLGRGRYDAALLREPEERDVIRLLAAFPDLVNQSARQLSPAPVANFLLDLTKAYARMYHEHEVLRASSPELLRARLQLALCVAQVLRNGLRLLTIAAPERM